MTIAASSHKISISLKNNANYSVYTYQLLNNIAILYHPSFNCMSTCIRCAEKDSFNKKLSHRSRTCTWQNTTGCCTNTAITDVISRKKQYALTDERGFIRSALCLCLIIYYIIIIVYCLFQTHIQYPQNHYTLCTLFTA